MRFFFANFWGFKTRKMYVLNTFVNVYYLYYNIFYDNNNDNNYVLKTHITHFVFKTNIYYYC